MTNTVMSNLEVDVLDELGSSLSSSLPDPPSLSRKSAPEGLRRVLSSVWLRQFCRMCSGSYTGLTASFFVVIDVDIYPLSKGSAWCQ